MWLLKFLHSSLKAAKDKNAMQVKTKPVNKMNGVKQNRWLVSSKLHGSFFYVFVCYLF